MRRRLAPGLTEVKKKFQNLFFQKKYFQKVFFKKNFQRNLFLSKKSIFSKKSLFFFSKKEICIK